MGAQEQELLYRLEMWDDGDTRIEDRCGKFCKGGHP
jgi:hypothetical protein